MKDKIAHPLLLALITFSIYFFTSGSVLERNLLVPPFGDPFTYTNYWMGLIEQSRHNYIIGLFNSLKSWYLTQSFIVSLGAPLLNQDPVAIAKINFVVVLFVAFQIYFCTLKIQGSSKFSLLLASLYLSLPWHYLITDAISLYSLQLDTIYINLLLCLSFLILRTLKFPTTNGLIFLGVLAGITMWSRSNSPGVIMIYFACISCAWIFVYKNPLSNALKIISLPLFIFILMAALYYYNFFNIVFGYYKPLQGIVSSGGTITLAFLKEKLLYIPGVFFAGTWAYQGKTIPVLSLFSHLLELSSAFYVIFTNKQDSEFKLAKLLIISGAAIYSGIIFFFLALFHTNDSFFYQPYAPCLSGIFLTLSGILILIRPQRISAELSLMLTLLIPLASSIIFTQYSAKVPLAGPTAIEINSFSNSLEKDLSDGSIAFLWYETYSTPLINYYRKLSGKPIINESSYPLSLYKNKYWNDLWIPNPINNNEIIELALSLAFRESKYIVMADNINCYNKNQPYPIYRNINILFDLRRQNSKNLRLVKSINEKIIGGQECKLLIFENLIYEK